MLWLVVLLQAAPEPRLASPAETARALREAMERGDAAAVRACFRGDTPERAALADAHAALLLASARLHAEVRRLQGDAVEAPVEAPAIREDGDVAAWAMPFGEPLQMRMVGPVWLLDPLGEGDPSAAAERATLLRTMAQAIELVREGILEGRFTTAEGVEQALAQQVHQVLAGAWHPPKPTTRRSAVAPVEAAPVKVAPVEVAPVEVAPVEVAP